AHISAQVANSLHGLVRRLLKPYDHEHASRVFLEGADVRINDRAATPLTLIFHELATNSAKYGALSVPDGTVRLTFSDHDKQLRVVWKEASALAVAPSPARNGFGSKLFAL